MAASVTIQNLSRQFDRTLAVDNVTLDIRAGELFFLLGPSGCGKTTLLRCVAGFCEPDRGRILIGERDVTTLAPHLRDTGMVFQSYALWPHMTVRENVAFGLEMRKLGGRELAQRVASALAMVRMSDRATARPNQLSGGQQQRVALARALVIHPQCLLLDEPLSNLDAKLRLEMRREIRRICKEVGCTAIYVTHDQKEALSIADRIAVIDAGCVRQLGSAEDLYRRPNSRFVANFIGETNFLEGTVETTDRHGVSIRTVLGTLVSRNGTEQDLRKGMRVTVSLRPEAVVVGPAPADAVNRFDGTIRETVYLGEMAQHQVTVQGAGDSITLTVCELNPRQGAVAQAVATRIRVAPEDVVVLKE